MIQASQTRRQLRDFALRLVLIAASLLALGRIFASPLITPVLPAFAWVIEAADYRYRVDSIAIDPSKTFIKLTVTPIHALVISGSRVLLPDAALHFYPSALVGSVLQPIILLLAVVLAWPATTLAALAMRLLLAVPATVVLLFVNVPRALLGSLIDFREIFPDAPVSLIVYWNDFLQTGGPLVLGLAAGALVVSAGDALGYGDSSRASLAGRSSAVP